MEDLVMSYYNHIIKPIEERCIELEEKIYRQLLLEKYASLGKIISEEYEFLEEFHRGKQKQ